MIPTLPLREAEIEITRRCNLNCAYCVIPEDKRRREDELSIEQWKRGIDNLEKIGIRLINFMGGEPCVKEGIEELIAHVNSKPAFDYLFSTNGIIAVHILDKLLAAGLKNVAVSIDGIYLEEKELRGCADTAFKSYHGLKLFERLKKEGVKKLIGNFVVNKATLDKILPTYVYFAERGHYLNLTPEQWLKYGSPKKAPLCLTEEDRPKIENIFAELVKIKQSETNWLINSEAFLVNFADLAIKQNYKCRRLGVLGVFEDGNIWYCSGWEGGIGKSRKYNVLELDREKLQDLLNEWRMDFEGNQCPGCTFSFRDRTGDFNYLLEKGGPNLWFSRNFPEYV